MSVDLSQFHQVFFEESYEGLDIMESALLNIDLANLDSETINAIFRAAHSIKGGSGTFGFNEIAQFTHVVETLLDLIRSDQFVMEADHVDLFLKSVDCIRTMINELEAGDPCETTVANELRVLFTALLDGDNTVPAEDSANSSSQGEGVSGWQIYFKPDVDVLRTGNDPVRMFRELAELGEIEVSCVTDELPELITLDPESCFLAWNITFKGEVDRAEIDEVFEWVVDDSDIVIEALDSMGQTPDDSVAQTVSEESTESNSVAETVSEEPKAGNTSSSEQTEPVAEAKAVKAPVAKKDSKPESVSIRVGTDKIDSLINMVGELVITQSMLNELGKDFTVDMMPKLMEGLEQLSLHTRELQ